MNTRPPVRVAPARARAHQTPSAIIPRNKALLLATFASLSLVALTTGAAVAQDAAGDSQSSTELPDVEVIQEQDAPAAATQQAQEPSSSSQQTAPPASSTAASTVPADVQAVEAATPAANFTPQRADGDTLVRGATGIDGYFVEGTSTATKTNTPIKDLPQSVTIITRELADDQGNSSVADALRYVPGVTVQQGEGHRDEITIRGQETTADFFVDGVRDDIQTFRDLYNAQALEVLKGPAAMVFGRGGGGGVVNRVTKKADGRRVYEGTVEFGAHERKRVTIDAGDAITSDLAFRLNAMYEDSATFRDFSELERYGINPTMAFKLGDQTRVHLSYEYKVHEQNVDRGGPSQNGVPFEYPREIYFGQPNVSYTDFEGHIATATIEHEFDNGIQLRNHAFYANYDKLYQNIFSDSAVGAPGPGLVELDGYRNVTTRETFINQTDASLKFDTGPLMRHTLLAGVEVAFQDTADARNLPSFNTPLSGTNTLNVSAANPTVFNPVFFDRPSRRRFTDLTSTSVYLQDQLEITRFFELIGGIRFERFDLEFRNGLNGTVLSRVDEVWSPRVGAVVKPTRDVSLYASYSKSFLPQSGDQFSNLSVDAASLEPEEFENYEIGFKWQVASRLFFTGALYQLDRQNQRVTVAPDVTAATGLTRTKGGELGLSGYVTDEWQIYAGYANTNSKIENAGTNLARVGNSVEATPRHTFSIWNRYQLTDMWGVGLGVIHQSSWFAEAGNAVTIPGFTRADAAIYLNLDENWSAQLNVQNIFNEDYWITTHNDDNISYGAPRAAYVSVKAKY